MHLDHLSIRILGYTKYKLKCKIKARIRQIMDEIKKIIEHISCRISTSIMLKLAKRPWDVCSILECEKKWERLANRNYLRWAFALLFISKYKRTFRERLANSHKAVYNKKFGVWFPHKLIEKLYVLNFLRKPASYNGVRKK